MMIVNGRNTQGVAPSAGKQRRRCRVASSKSYDPDEDRAMDGPPNDEVTRHVRKTAQAIAELHAAHRAGSTPAERRLERLVAHLSTPWFIGLVTISITAWIGAGALSA